MLLLIFIAVCLINSNVSVKSGLRTYVKVIHIAVFAMCLVVYMFVKKRLDKKTENKKLICLYKYMYLGVLVLVSRIGLFYLFKSRKVLAILPSFGEGLGSYINYGMSILLNNAMYANIIINTVLTFIIVVLIKKLMFKITSSDFLSTLSAVLCIMLPFSMYNVTYYDKFTYNLVFTLLGLNLIIKIIDEVKQYKLKTNNYVYMSILLGFVISIDILFKGSYIFWATIILVIIPAASYIDVFHLSFGGKMKFKKIICKIEQLNISKLVKVAAYSMLMSGIVKIILTILSAGRYHANFINENYFESIKGALMLSRNYYILLIVVILTFEIIGIVLKRKIDIKMTVIKLFNIMSVLYIILNGTACILFDVSLILLAVCNICNIYYNREEKIKLLKDKN